ncbi:hypothetical protein, partial [Cloacibacillus porcorum]
SATQEKLFRTFLASSFSYFPFHLFGNPFFNVKNPRGQTSQKSLLSFPPPLLANGLDIPSLTNSV